ncbi:hypothetical protein DF3PA_70078 [Candidatus Defluviicoccus seviourii]|uniref:Uncharacterized protein n=1 Tax=Candidatus Defluviicoccus seviourii TaxID=2565273 RepID=A0A564WH46_9PROT|nr:hypothetical protein DF3PA_70078 [Candidatus Defluviicoccus seviourii]
MRPHGHRSQPCHHRWTKLRADTGEQLVAHVSVGVEAGLAAALDDRGIERVPEDHLACHRPGEFDRAVLRFRRQRDHQIERLVFQVVERFRPVAADVDADLVHRLDRKGVDRARAHAGGVDEDPASGQVLEDAFRHRRTDGVLGAGEQNGGRAKEQGMLRLGCAGRRRG